VLACLIVDTETMARGLQFGVQDVICAWQLSYVCDKYELTKLRKQFVILTG